MVTGDGATLFVVAVAVVVVVDVVVVLVEMLFGAADEEDDSTSRSLLSIDDIRLRIVFPSTGSDPLPPNTATDTETPGLICLVWNAGEPLLLLLLPLPLPLLLSLLLLLFVEDVVGRATCCFVSFLHFCRNKIFNC
jgi:hypothetical protein